ncbi:orotidine-5'-phosphate decarboxylase [Ferviditalea candida]|uniref:Orotidine 5'-phosphate decarboxylase n=1 Tax=Ferviditalea candida TaxID=3108399 RepID=A0ABU5ZDL7_9BACL|nr:orotidine-5'-phosphate decarboxylase [Paenibacillaceae bacterium T2]
MKSHTAIAEKIIVALDVPHPSDAKKLLSELKGIPCYLKVGMQLFYASGPQFILMLKEQGYRVFLDLKLHDIPNTVKGAADSITRLGVDMFNVHAAGGSRMMEAALEGIDTALSARVGIQRPIVIAVTQLTSTSQIVLNSEIGIPGNVEESVLHYANLAKQAGLNGVVTSPLEVAAIKQTCGSSFLTIVPGIRPHGSAIGDQFRIMSPKQAFAQGADYIVIGRPITTADNPRQALESIIKELSEP